jgi:hypothetical protein
MRRARDLQVDINCLFILQSGTATQRCNSRADYIDNTVTVHWQYVDSTLTVDRFAAFMLVVRFIFLTELQLELGTTETSWRQKKPETIVEPSTVVSASCSRRCFTVIRAQGVKFGNIIGRTAHGAPSTVIWRTISDVIERINWRRTTLIRTILMRCCAFDVLCRSIEPAACQIMQSG